MTSPSTDRRYGLNAGIAIKAPCVAATTAAITLNGEQTIDGVSVVTGDRVLVKNQSSSADNGIYVCDSGDWTRDIDANGNRDIVNGTLVKVNGGSTNAAGLWVTSTTDPCTIGTTAITYANSGVISGLSTYSVATASQTAFTVPVYAAGGYLQVTRNGLVQRLGASYDYVETNTTTITFNAGLTVGDVVGVRML
jgi:phage-related tail fiber protein